MKLERKRKREYYQRRVLEREGKRELKKMRMRTMPGGLIYGPDEGCGNLNKQNGGLEY